MHNSNGINRIGIGIPPYCALARRRRVRRTKSKAKKTALLLAGYCNCILCASILGSAHQDALVFFRRIGAGVTAARPIYVNPFAGGKNDSGSSSSRHNDRSTSSVFGPSIAKLKYINLMIRTLHTIVGSRVLSASATESSQH